MMYFDDSDFRVEHIDDFGILVEALWGARAFVSSWHLVDEKKLMLNRMTKPDGWHYIKEAMAEKGEHQE